MVVMLLTSFSAVSLGVMTLAQQASVSVDPFAAYIDILPGQLRSAMETWKFSCVYGAVYSPGVEICRLDPADPIFSRIGVVITNGRVWQTTFMLHDDVLELGDLMLRLGTPSIHIDPRATFFSWQEDSVTAALFVSSGQFSVFSPIWQITFTDAKLVSDLLT
jgi:hypothetical protein